MRTYHRSMIGVLIAALLLTLTGVPQQIPAARAQRPMPLAPGICDTAGPIEVEGTLLGTTPTAYATLGAAFAAINAGTHTGAISIDVCGDTNELAATATLNASGSGSASYTSIAISPVGGAARTISGTTTAGSPLIDLNGADNVTIDGLNTGGNSLTIANTTISATSDTSTIRFINGAANNIITNSNIQGSGTMPVATNGAVIFFSTDAVTVNGNDNNTISNNNIGPAGANLPTKAILGNGSTTTTAIGNSGILITNNNIFDFFGTAVTSSGIATNGGCNTWTITNNRFYQTGTRTWTTGATHRAIDISNATITSGAQGFTITGNTIGYASSSQAGTYALTGSTGKFQGIYYSGIPGSTLTNINNNTVAAVSLTGMTSSGTGTASPFAAIVISDGPVNTDNNIIGSQSATGSLTFSTNSTTATDVYGLANFSADNWTATGNTIGGLAVTNAAASGTFIIYGLRANPSTSYSFTATSNTVGGTVANSIQLTATGVASQIVGLHASNAAAIFTSNTIRNVTTNIGTGTTTSASVIGINVTTAAFNHTLSQNTIYGLYNSNATGASIVTGIQFTGSTANVVERNLIYGLMVATNSATAEVNGLRVAGGTTIYRNNMIAVGSGMANAFGGAATNSSTAGIVGINEVLGTNSFFHNSVFIDGTAMTGSGSSYAFNGVQTVNPRSFRNNIFFNARTNSGVSTAKHYAIKINGTAANPAGLTLNNNLYFADGMGAVFGFFNSLDVAGLAAWRTAVGQDKASFEDDPGFTDPTNVVPDLHLLPASLTVAEGNGVDVGVTNDFDGETRATLTPVDIGADAGNYDGIDLVAPSMTYTAFGNTSSSANRVLSVTVTDATGVDTGGLAPRAYFNKNAGAYSSTACSLSSGTVQSGVWACTLDYSLVGGVVIADVIRYFVVAQDTLGNLAANPDTGFTGTTVNTVTTPPTTPRQYTILTGFSGSYNIGAAPNAACATVQYTSITAAAAALNAGELIGPTNFVLCDVSYSAGETFPITFNANPGSNVTNTVTIKPAVGVQSVVSGSSASAIFKLNGADYVTFDGSNTAGGTTRDLTVTNISTASSTATIWVSSLGTGAGSTNVTLKNMTLAAGSNSATTYAISVGGATIGTAGDDNDNLSIQNNAINTAYYAIYAMGSTAGGVLDGLAVTGNSIGDASVAKYVTYRGVAVAYAAAPTIAQNTIFNMVTSAAIVNAAIDLGSYVTNALVSGNSINHIYSTNTSGYGASGINLSSGTGTSGVTIVNNFIYDLQTSNYSNSSTLYNPFGIRITGGTGHKVYFNSVYLYGAPTGGSSASMSAAFLVTGGSGLDVRDNIFANAMTGLAGTRSYAIYGQSGAYTTINYNDYYATGTYRVLGYQGGDITTLAGWRAATGQDANSISANPHFVSTTNLHIDPATPTAIESAGTPVAGVTADYDGDTRNVTTPDLGADEGSFLVFCAYIWGGATSADWHTAANWTCNFVPGATDDVVIPAGTPNNPVIGANVTLNSLTINSGGAQVTLNGGDLTATGSLTINVGSALNVGVHTLTVMGTLTNHGQITQTRPVTGSGDVTFVGTGGYGGVTINANGVDLGATTVTVRGNQACDTTDSLVHRCFNITPANTAGLNATITFYFSAAELNGSACASMDAYHWSSGWNLLTAAGRQCATEPYSLQVTGVSTFSPFGLRSSFPTAVTLSNLAARSADGSPLLPLAGLVMSIAAVALIVQRKRR